MHDVTSCFTDLSFVVYTISMVVLLTKTYMIKQPQHRKVLLWKRVNVPLNVDSISLACFSPFPNPFLIDLCTNTSRAYTAEPLTHSRTPVLICLVHMSLSLSRFPSFQSRQTSPWGAEVSPVCLRVFLDPQHQKYSQTWQFECARRLSEDVYQFLERFGKNDGTKGRRESEEIPHKAVTPGRARTKRFSHFEQKTAPIGTDSINISHFIVPKWIFCVDPYSILNLGTQRFEIALVSKNRPFDGYPKKRSKLINFPSTADPRRNGPKVMVKTSPFRGKWPLQRHIAFQMGLNWNIINKASPSDRPTMEAMRGKTISAHSNIDFETH